MSNLRLEEVLSLEQTHLLTQQIPELLHKQPEPLRATRGR